MTYTTKVNAQSLKAVLNAIEGKVIKTYLAAPEGYTGKQVTAVTSDDADISMLEIKGESSSVFVSNLISENAEFVFECNEEVYNQLVDGTVDYVTYVREKYFELDTTRFNYSITVLMHEDQIAHKFTLYGVCTKCDDIHILNEVDFAKISMDDDRGIWSIDRGPFSDSVYKALYVAAEDYDILLGLVRDTVEVSRKKAEKLLTTKFTIGDEVHGSFGIGIVVDCIESFDINQVTGKRVSRPAGKLAIAVGDKISYASVVNTTAGLPKELAC